MQIDFLSNAKAAVIETVTSPLGFFTLSLLMLEGFLAIVVLGSSQSLPFQTIQLGMWMSTFSFVLLVGLVALMVWKKPQNLTFRGKDWKEQLNTKVVWGTEKKPLEYGEYKDLQDNKKQQPLRTKKA